MHHVTSRPVPGLLGPCVGLGRSHAVSTIVCDTSSTRVGLMGSSVGVGIGVFSTCDTRRHLAVNKVNTRACANVLQTSCWVNFCCGCVEGPGPSPLNPPENSGLGVCCCGNQAQGQRDVFAQKKTCMWSQNGLHPLKQNTVFTREQVAQVQDAPSILFWFSGIRLC